MGFVNPKNYDLLFIACAASSFEQYFSENGASKLNCMIQERSELSSEDAFALIADAIEEGLIFVQKIYQRRLVINDRIFNEWRDKYTEEMPEIQASLMSPRWPLRPYYRQLTNEERDILNKNIRKGRLYEVVRRKN